MNGIYDLARFLMVETMRNYGGTVNIYGFSPDDGWMVGGVVEAEVHDLPAHSGTQVDWITQFIVTHVDTLMGHPELYVGTWWDDHKLYIDISERYPTESEALEVAVVRNELAVYNLTTHETIRVGSGYDIAHADPADEIQE